jgi:hypothetical protein
MNSPDRVFEVACTNLLRTAHVRTLGGKRRVSRRRTIALSYSDLNQLLSGTSLDELQTIATDAYREQVTNAGLLDPQRAALVSIVAMPGLGRGRYVIWDTDELALASDDAPAAKGARRTSWAAADAGPAAGTYAATRGGCEVMGDDQREPDMTRDFNNDQTQEMLTPPPQLRVLVDGKPTFTAARDAFKIGRDISCDIVLSSRTVSRVHARFEPTDTGWLVTDAGSRHGLWIGDERVRSFRLPPGVTMLRLGPVGAVTLKLHAAVA